MRVSTNKTNNANAVISAVFDKEAIGGAEQNAASKIAREINIPGFRKGKVPLAVIKDRFKDRLIADAKSLLVTKAYEEGVKTLEKSEIIGMPIVTKADDRDGSLEVELKVSLRPAFDLGDYMAIVPAAAEIRVNDAELNETIQKAADSVTPAETVSEKRGLADGDIAQFDFKGFMDGAAMKGGSAENYELKIGSKSFVPGFEEQMIGLKAGENREIKVTFPSDYHAGDLAGKEARFEVTLKAIKVKKSAVLDDETAKKLLPNIKDASVEKLREVMAKTLGDEKKAKLYNEDLRPNLLEALAQKYSFDLPEIILEQEIDHLASGKARGLSAEELKKLKDDESALKALREEFKEEAKERVKTTLLIDAIAKKENIKISDQEVAQAIYYQALQSGQNPKELLDHYRKNNLFAVVRMSLTEDRVLTTLLDRKAAIGADAGAEEKTQEKTEEKARQKTEGKPEKKAQEKAEAKTGKKPQKKVKDSE